MEGCREILIALPDSGGDIYRHHQLVWGAVDGQVRQGRDFLFTVISPHLARVRSTSLTRGSTSALREGALQLRLVTARRNGQRMTPLSEIEALELTRGLLLGHGIEADALQVTDQTIVSGSKIARDSGTVLRIALPVSTLRFDGRVVHRGKAALAWARGVGRGKRFGFGMMQAV